jgi:GntR family transcriptional repressor for pyruvate dehydrogenase complex
MTSTAESHRVARALLAGIIAGAYPAGLRLPPEVELAESFGCGRSTIREALRELSTMGVVRSRRGSGVVVLDFRLEGTLALLPAYLAAGAGDVDPLVLATELLRMRALLAKEAVRLAALYGKPEGFRAARAKLAAWRPEGSPIDQARAEIGVFRALVGASKIWPAIWLANAYFAPLDDVHSLLAPLVGGSPPDFERSMLHLLELVERGDEPAASRHFAKWIDGVDEILLARLTAVLRPDAPIPAAQSIASPAARNDVRHKPQKKASNKRMEAPR